MRRCRTNLMDDINQWGYQREDTDVEEAWRCGFCNLYVYNLGWKNGVSFPVAGAPPPRYVSKQYPRVCILCFDMAKLFEENPYFLRIQAAWEERDKKKSVY